MNLRRPAVSWDYGFDDPGPEGGMPTFGITRTEVVGDQKRVHLNAIEIHTSSEDRGCILGWLEQMEWAHFRRERCKHNTFHRAVGMAAAIKYLGKIGQSEHVTIADRVRAGDAE